MSNRSGGSDGGFAFYGWTDAGVKFNGTVTFTKVTDDYKYYAFGLLAIKFAIKCLKWSC